MSYPDETNPGQFIGTTQIYDLGEDNVNAEDFTVRLRQNFNNLIMSLNIKDSGYYGQEEFVNGQLFYPDYSRVNSATSAPATFRQVFRKVIDFGALPDIAGSPKSIAHNITFLPGAGNTTFIATRIYGAATDQTNRLMIPLPHFTVGGVLIDLTVDATNVIISSTSNAYTTFARTHVVLEYIKW